MPLFYCSRAADKESMLHVLKIPFLLTDLSIGVTAVEDTKSNRW